jgi:hypothetical protein
VRTFKQPPGDYLHPPPDFVKAHLLSGGGSGRWQFWSAAVDEFDTRPLAGRGAGSYQAWWAQHGTIAFFVRDAHSLYLEVMGELGILGLLLVAGAFAGGLVAGVRRLLTLAGAERDVCAGLLAAFAAYAVGAGIDWMWEISAVSAVGMFCLGLLAGRAVPAADEPIPTPPRRPRIGLPGRAAVGVASLVVIGLVLIPWLTASAIDASRDATRRDDARVALRDAENARAVQPWASTPYLQLALVNEQLGQIDEARRRIGQALDRDTSDWRLWLVAARLEAKAGRVRAARADLARARHLNPRSPLFVQIAG